jgi:hypothetical protein
LEHTDYLGDTLGAIAGEKAGIIKPHRPLALAEQSPEALAVFREKAAAKDAPLYYAPEYVDIENIRVHRDGTDFTLVCRKPGLFDAPLTSLFPCRERFRLKTRVWRCLPLKRRILLLPPGRSAGALRIVNSRRGLSGSVMIRRL